MGADTSSPRGLVVLLDKRVFLQSEAQSGLLNKGRSGALPLEIGDRIRPFLNFSWEKVPFKLLRKIQTQAQHLISHPLKARQVAQSMLAGPKASMRNMLFGVPPYTEFRGLLRLSCVE